MVELGGIQYVATDMSPLSQGKEGGGCIWSQKPRKPLDNNQTNDIDDCRKQQKSS